MRLAALVAVALLGTQVTAGAQAPPRTARIGILLFSTPTADPNLAVFRSAMRDLGWVEGRNLTFLLSDLAAKRVEILREIAPKVSAVGVLWNPDHRDPDFRETQAAAAPLGLRVVSLEVRRPAELDAAFQAALRERVEALIVVSSRLMVRERARILEFGTRHRLPMATGRGGWAEGGALLAYGPSIDEIVRRSARHVDRVLRGARPGDLPIEQPTRFELVVNLRVAQALGLTATPSLLARADRVIQ
jgi:putative ABC transport system substrate-binding protein